MIRKLSTLKRDAIFAALATGAVTMISIFGQIATYPNLSWYGGLTKPSFNPPNWIFAPVWTTIYILMACALWRILRVSTGSSTTRLPIVLFFILLAFNAAWPWMFFWAHSPLLGMANIAPQFGVILATIVVVAWLDRPAAICLLPLAAWVGFASVLNIVIWLLNR